MRNFVSRNRKSILKSGNLRIFSRVSKSRDRNGRQKVEGFVWEKNSCHPVTLNWFSIQTLVNLEKKSCSKIFP